MGDRARDLPDRDTLAMLLLDAYGGTIDDEGEGEAEARLAIDGYLGGLLPVGRANLL